MEGLSRRNKERATHEKHSGTKPKAYNYAAHHIPRNHHLSTIWSPPLTPRFIRDRNNREIEGEKTVVSRISVLWFSELVASGIGSRAWGSATGTVLNSPDDAPPFFYLLAWEQGRTIQYDLCYRREPSFYIFPMGVSSAEIFGDWRVLWFSCSSILSGCRLSSLSSLYSFRVQYRVWWDFYYFVTFDNFIRTFMLMDTGYRYT